MYEWIKAIQAMIDWIEENIEDNPTLAQMSKQIGYSNFYCSVQFHRIVGMTLKSYIAGRRLCKATLDVRDSEERILDIAIKYGFSSQGALTRAFRDAYGCTPAAYRKKPVPIPLSIKKVVLNPSHFIKKGDIVMSENILTNPFVWMEHIPAHKFIGIWDINAKGYWDFEKRKDFDEIEGILDSMRPVMHPVVWAHTAGWFYDKGKKGYFYGVGVPTDYDGEIPKGFEIREYPESYYMVFCHPSFDYLNDNGEVMKRVENLEDNNPRII